MPLISYLLADTKDKSINRGSILVAKLRWPHTDLSIETIEWLFRIVERS